MGGGIENSANLLYHHAKYGGDHASHAVCRRKSVIFLFVCHAFELQSLWKQKLSIKQRNFQNNYGAIA